MKLDFHNHILPGLDDGATTPEDFLMLAKALKDWGFERVTCTPHITNLHRNTPDTIRTVFEKMQETISSSGIDLDIRMSAEYRLVPETWPEVLKNKWLMPIEDRYILMELPISKPEQMGYIKPMEEFRKVISLGLTPILPHPERYLYLSQSELLSYVEAGVKIQCNYGSLAGLYGETVEQNVRKIISEGIVSFYATDLHNAHYVEVLSQWFAAGNAIAEVQSMISGQR